MSRLPVRVTPTNFARFGTVVTAPSVAPTSQGTDYRFWSDITHYAIDGETEIGLCTVFRQPSPAIGAVERHLRTPEILIPADAPFHLPLAGDADGDTMVFTVHPGEAVVLNPGVWHGPCLPVDSETATYFVVFRRGTPGEDVQKKAIPPFTIDEA